MQGDRNPIAGRWRPLHHVPGSEAGGGTGTVRPPKRVRPLRARVEREAAPGWGRELPFLQAAHHHDRVAHSTLTLFMKTHDSACNLI